MTTLEWVESRKRAWGETSPKYMCNVLAEFPEEGKHTVIPLWAILAAERRTIEDIEEAGDVPDYNHLGVDVARYGDDLSIAYHMNGPYANKVMQESKQDIIQIGRRVRDLNRTHKFKKINVDSDGLGAGVTDYLKREAKLNNVHEIYSGAKASKPKEFYNKRAEMAWKLRERFTEKQDIILNDEETGTQLASLRFEYKQKGGHDVYKLEDKKKTKKRLGRSPDDADALIYASEDKKRVDLSKCIIFT
jgi:hypothetical protein